MAGNTKYASIPFNAVMSEDVSPHTLQPPGFEKLVNLKYLKTGSLHSRDSMNTLSTVPLYENIENFHKLFTYEDQLLYMGNSEVRSYDEEQREWNTIAFRGQLSIDTIKISQKERDIKLPLCLKWQKNIYVFYTSQNKIFYKIYNLTNKRVMTGELTIPSNFDNIVALQGTSDNQNLWLAVIDPAKVSFFKLKVLLNTRLEVETTSEFEQAGIVRSAMAGNRFYWYEGVNRNFHIFNEDGDPPEHTPFDIEMRDPSAHAKNFSNFTLYDFKDWAFFNDPERGDAFQVIWSVQTGFFIINANDQVMGNIYANFTPYDIDADSETANLYSRYFTGDSFVNRMIHVGAAVYDGNKAYFPILREGQAEQIGPTNVLYPLGVDLVEINFKPQFPSQIAKVGEQMLITGSTNSYFNGNDFVELQFTERPKIAKTSSQDYAVWPFEHLLEARVLELPELQPDQFVSFTTDISKKDGPYMVTSVGFTAASSGGKVGISTGSGWTGEADDRKLRYATELNSGDPSEEGLTLSNLYYETTEKAIVAEFTGASALGDAESYPGGIILNGLFYEFMYHAVSGGTLKSYHFLDTSPIVAGQDYSAKVVQMTELVTPSSLDHQVRAASDGVKRLDIREVSLRKFTDRTLFTESAGIESIITSLIDFAELSSSSGEDTEGSLNSSVVTFGELSSRVEDTTETTPINENTPTSQSNVSFDFLETISSTYKVPEFQSRLATLSGSFGFDPGNSFSVGSSLVCLFNRASATSFYYKAYSFSSPSTFNFSHDLTKDGDYNHVNGAGYSGGAFVVSLSSNTGSYKLNFYRLSGGRLSRQSSREISLPSKRYFNMFIHGTNLYLGYNSGSSIIFDRYSISGNGRPTLSASNALTYRRKTINSRNPSSIVSFIPVGNILYVWERRLFDLGRNAEISHYTISGNTFRDVSDSIYDRGDNFRDAGVNVLASDGGSGGMFLQPGKYH